MMGFNFVAIAKSALPEAQTILKGATTKIGSELGGVAKVGEHMTFPLTKVEIPHSFTESPTFLGAPAPKRFVTPEASALPEVVAPPAKVSTQQESRALQLAENQKRMGAYQSANETFLKGHYTDGLPTFKPEEIAKLKGATPAEIKAELIAKGHSPKNDFEGWLQGERVQAYNALNQPQVVSSVVTPPPAIAEVPIASTVATPTGTSLVAPINASVTTPFSSTSYVPTNGVKVAESVPLTGPASSVIPKMPDGTTPVKFTTTTPGGAPLQTVPTMPGASAPVMPNTPTAPAGNTVPVNPDTKKFWTPVKIGGASVLGVGTVVGGATIAQNVGGSAATVAPAALEYNPTFNTGSGMAF